jgi:hypothetical protein
MTTKREFVPTRLPQPRPWSEPITEQQHGVFSPDCLELVDGYLMGGAEDGKHRWELLALLLTNVGLSLALSMCNVDDVRDAVEYNFETLYP